MRITHYLPSGRYQVAMVPYIKDDNDTMIPMAPPSCSTRLLRINLGQYALHITFFLLFSVILSGIGTHFWQEGQEKEFQAEMVKERVSLPDIIYSSLALVQIRLGYDSPVADPEELEPFNPDSELGEIGE